MDTERSTATQIRTSRAQDEAEARREAQQALQRSMESRW